MAGVLAKRRLRAVTVGLMVFVAPVPLLAGGSTSPDGGNSVFDAGSMPGASGSSAGAAAVAVQGITTLLSLPASPAVAGALQSLSEALNSAGPGTPEAAGAVAAALAVIITPEVAANPPALSASETETAVTLLNNIIAGLTAQGVAVPPAMATLVATLVSRIS